MKFILEISNTSKDFIHFSPFLENLKKVFSVSNQIPPSQVCFNPLSIIPDFCHDRSDNIACHTVLHLYSLGSETLKINSRFTYNFLFLLLQCIFCQMQTNK